MKLQVEKKFYEDFISSFELGGPLRLGQAFYNHLDLHKVTDRSPQQQLNRLYELDGQDAIKYINTIFELV